MRVWDVTAIRGLFRFRFNPHVVSPPTTFSSQLLKFLENIAPLVGIMISSTGVTRSLLGRAVPFGMVGLSVANHLPSPPAVVRAISFRQSRDKCEIALLAMPDGYGKPIDAVKQIVTIPG
jgi:hypothetical protein